jgi:hypothetical protein
MSEEIKNKVEKTVNSSGYPLELYISSVLWNHDELVWHNEYFFDNDLKIARSVDLYVPVFPRKKMDLKSTLNSAVAIECKKSPDTAWVFFEAITGITPDFMGQFIDCTQILKNQYSKRHLLWDIGGTANLHYSAQTPMKSAQNFQVVKIGDTDLLNEGKAIKRKDTIFEAINQVTKFICYRILRDEQLYLNEWIRVGRIESKFDLYFPVIVFDGPMFSGVLKDNEIKLHEVDQVLLEHKYQPIYAKEPLVFYIDIVKKEKFLELLDVLKNDIEVIENQLSKHNNEIEKHIHGMYVSESRLNQSKSRW